MNCAVMDRMVGLLISRVAGGSEYETAFSNREGARERARDTIPGHPRFRFGSRRVFESAISPVMHGGIVVTNKRD
jgi:hypothetical protein